MGGRHNPGSDGSISSTYILPVVSSIPFSSRYPYSGCSTPTLFFEARIASYCYVISSPDSCTWTFGKGIASFAFQIICRRNEIELCARLLGVAAVGLNQNPGLVFFVLVSKIALSLLTLPMYGLMFVAYTNGKIVPNGNPSLFVQLPL